MDPSCVSETRLCASAPHSRATAGIGVLSSSDHALVDLEYCCMETSLPPAMAKNWPVQSHRRRSIWPPISSNFICVDLRRSHIDTFVDPLLTAASQVPFSENDRACTGAETSRFAAFAPDVTTYILIWPSAPPAANKWPSGWNSALVRPRIMLASTLFVDWENSN